MAGSVPASLAGENHRRFRDGPVESRGVEKPPGPHLDRGAESRREAEGQPATRPGPLKMPCPPARLGLQQVRPAEKSLFEPDEIGRSRALLWPVHPCRSGLAEERVLHISQNDDPPGIAELPDGGVEAGEIDARRACDR